VRKLPTIQALADRVQDFSDKVDFWNLLMVWGLAIAALAAIAVGISTRLVIVRSGQLAAAQVDLDSAKEKQLQRELKEKDRQIAEAKHQASQSNEAAGKANERAANLEIKAAELELERVKIEQTVTFNGPRGLAIKAARESIVDSLMNFKGQKVKHYFCTGAFVPATHEEISLADNAIMLALHDAGWEVLGPNRYPDLWARQSDR
jgi:hypothetical protein